MNFLDFIIAVPLFAGGLLFWPGYWIFNNSSQPRQLELKRIFRRTFAALSGVGVMFGIVILVGRFDHNWLRVTLLFPLINLVSIFFSVGSLVRHRPTNQQSG